MHPELFRLPLFDTSIKSYGFMMMVAFLLAIWIAMRWAQRVKADPDMILNLGFVSLISGVVGARLFFVIHYWKTDFAMKSRPLLSALELWSGGMEYYGGLLGAVAAVVIYLRFFGRTYGLGDDFTVKPQRRPSVRLYLDILAPAAMLGLGITRVGCFLNGCCWGGACVLPHDHRVHAAVRPALPWAVQFPYGSPAYCRQWENRQVTVPGELIVDIAGLEANNFILPELLGAASLRAPVEDVEAPHNRLAELRKEYGQLPPEKRKGEASQQLKSEIKQLQGQVGEHAAVFLAMNYPSRVDPSRPITRSELQDLAAQCRSLPVHPAQLYAMVNGVLLCLLLYHVLLRRRRHGVVFGLMLILYPITRIILELIRVDNPTRGGLTISQSVSLALLVIGVIYLVVLYRQLPERSPRAVPFVMPESQPDDRR